jgi:hypothetical protein
MDDQPRDPAPQPEPTEAAAPLPPAPEPEPTQGWIPPVEGKSSRVLVRILASVAGLVLGALVFATFIGGSSDPHDQALEEFGQRLSAIPEFEARYGDVESGDEAFRLGQQLGVAGLARLPDDRLLRYWQLSSSMLGLADDADCAAIMRQTIDGTDAAALVRRLEIDEFREMLDITYTALESELTSAAGPSAPTSAEMEAASFALAGALGADTVVELGTTLSDTSAEDAAVCRAARSFVGGILDLEDPHRTTFLRYMVSQGV